MGKLKNSIVFLAYNSTFSFLLVLKTNLKIVRSMLLETMYKDLICDSNNIKTEQYKSRGFVCYWNKNGMYSN